MFKEWIKLYVLSELVTVQQSMCVCCSSFVCKIETNLLDKAKPEPDGLHQPLPPPISPLPLPSPATQLVLNRVYKNGKKKVLQSWEILAVNNKIMYMW